MKLLIKGFIKYVIYLFALFFFIAGFVATFDLYMNENPASELTNRQLNLIIMWIVGAYILTNFFKDFHYDKEDNKIQKKDKK
jgi:uncharacterized membrane protein